MVKQLTIISLLCGVALGLRAQLGVTAALDSTTILLGDQVRINFRATQPNGAEYLSADFRGILDTLEAIDLIQVETPRTEEAGHTTIVTQSVLIAGFEDGTHRIPGIRFSTKVNGNTYFVESNPVYLKVMPMAVDSTAGLRPIKNIMEEPRRISDWVHLVLIPLGLLLGLALLYFLVRRLTQPKAEKAQAVPPEPYVPPHIIAKEKIAALKARQLWQNGQLKPYYSEISHIAREYLENRYELNALESVTDEIMPEVAETDMPQDLQADLGYMLRTADMVKFAKMAPSGPTHPKVMAHLEELVERTLQIAPPPAEDSAETNDKPPAR